MGRIDGKEAVTLTAIAATLLGVGSYLFAFDMRTAGVPAEHIFFADMVTCVLAVASVASGVPAIAMHVADRRQSRGDH